MRVAIIAVALAASALACLVALGSGLVMASVQQSGTRGLGAGLIASGALCFGATLFLALAAPDRVRSGPERVGAALATLMALAPPVALAAGAFAFAGVPLGSTMPMLDWALFALGMGLSAGAIAIAILGYGRIRGARLGSQPRLPDSGSAEPQSGLMYRP